MNKTKMMMFATAIMFCVSATVMAQRPGGERGDRPERGERGGQRPAGERGERGGPGGDTGRMMQMMPILAALDADQDGVISKDEIDNAAVALRKLDKNNDGELDAEEMRPTRPSGGRGEGGERPERGARPEGGRAAGAAAEGARGIDDRIKRMMSLDKNDDGKISQEEAPERMKAAFERMDSDGDGFIDKSEIEAMGAAMGGGRGRGGQEGGAGRGGRGSDGGAQKPQRPDGDEDK